MLTHHLMDSVSLLAPLQRQRAGQQATRLLDVGSGGGLPGVVLAIAWPDLQVVCVDAIAKKVGFIREIAAQLKLTNLRAAHARVESLQEQPFDVITSRAFASLPEFVTLTRRLLAQGGVWVAMKGKRPDAEIAALPADVEVFHVEPLTVPGLGAERCLVWIAPVTLEEIAPYMGTWYQVAWFPNRFQKQCVSDTAATYRWLPAGEVEVVNRAGSPTAASTASPAFCRATPCHQPTRRAVVGKTTTTVRTCCSAGLT
jgi:16S rRNA (guanine527-N7)-methyltransferase